MTLIFDSWFHGVSGWGDCGTKGLDLGTRGMLVQIYVVLEKLVVKKCKGITNKTLKSETCCNEQWAEYLYIYMIFKTTITCKVQTQLANRLTPLIIIKVLPNSSSFKLLDSLRSSFSKPILINPVCVAPSTCVGLFVSTSYQVARLSLHASMLWSLRHKAKCIGTSFSTILEVSLFLLIEWITL